MSTIAQPTPEVKQKSTTPPPRGIRPDRPVARPPAGGAGAGVPQKKSDKDSSRRQAGGDRGGTPPGLACRYRNNSLTPEIDGTPVLPEVDCDAVTELEHRLPRYIRACERGGYTLSTWNRRTPGEVRFSRYKCRSWRHAGACRQARGAQDFARISTALQTRDDWVYMVLTYDQSAMRDRFGPYEARSRAYMHTARGWQSLRQWISRKYGSGKLEYIALIEQHASGWPHVNVIMYHPGLVADIAKRGWKAVRREMNPHVEACGFGKRFWFEGVKSKDAMAGYMVKLEHDGSHQKDAELAGELAKTTQAPVEAPHNFRRLRASRGLLPPIHHDPNVTGCLVKGNHDALVDILAVHGRVIVSEIKGSMLRISKVAGETLISDALTGEIRNESDTEVEPMTVEDMMRAYMAGRGVGEESG